MNLNEKADMSMGGNAIDGSRTIGLKELLNVLWLQRLLIIAVVFIFVACAGVAVVLNVPVYQTAALIKVNNASSNADTSGLSQLFGSMQGGGASQASQSMIEMTLIQSPYILEPTIHKLNLDVNVSSHYFPIIGRYFAQQYRGIGPAPAKWGLSSYAWGGESLGLGYFIAPISEHGKQFKLVVGENSTYKLLSPSGDLVLNGVVGKPAVSGDQTIQLLVQSLTARPKEVFYLQKNSLVQVMTGLTSGLQITELAPATASSGRTDSADTGIIQVSLQSTDPASAVKIINTVLDFIVQDNTHQKTLQATRMLEFIQGQVPMVKKRLQDAETELHHYQVSSGVIDLQGQSALLLQEMGAIDTQILSAHMSIAQSQGMYTNDNPIMQNMNAQLTSLEQQKQGLQREVSTLPMRDQVGINLTRELNVQEQLYILLLTNEQQYSLMKAAALGDVRILDAAKIPDESLPQKRAILLLASLFAGVIVGCFFVLIRHQFKNVVADPYWTEKEFGIRTVAILPFSKMQAKGKLDYDEKRVRRMPILAETTSADACMESIRALRTSVFFGLKEKQANLVNVTGVVPQAGKSFIAMNLAVVLAQTGKRVILLDADMRRGYLNRYFGKSHVPGLSEVLSGIHPLEKVIHQTHIDNLSFISSGLYPDNPSELLLQHRFKETLATLGERYEIVIVDSPPILSVNDASIIAKEIPINYLVIPGGQLKPHEVELAVRRFYNDGVVLTGVLFNFSKHRHEKFSAYVHYDAYKRYYASYDKKGVQDTADQQDR